MWDDGVDCQEGQATTWGEACAAVVFWSAITAILVGILAGAIPLAAAEKSGGQKAIPFPELQKAKLDAAAAKMETVQVDCQNRLGERRAAVQAVIDEARRTLKLDENWTPRTTAVRGPNGQAQMQLDVENPAFEPPTTTTTTTAPTTTTTIPAQ